MEIYARSASSDSVSFENGKLKDIDSKLLSGVSLRLFQAGKLGMAYTQNLVEREELVRNALVSLKGGAEADYELPGAAEFPKLEGDAIPRSGSSPIGR